MLYDDAIKLLTKAIKYNPKNLDAYLERAYAYFELNKVDLALKDYKIAKKLYVNPPFLQGMGSNFDSLRFYVPHDRLDFAAGLIKGILKGSKEAAVDFIPSVLSSLRGMCNGLWAFVCSPKEVSEEVINTAYTLMDYISEHTSFDCLECVVPEIGELSRGWKKLSDHSKGKKMGFIIGKYGVEIFAPLGAIKGVTYVKKIKALKRANTMATLENCAVSSSKKSKILIEASNHSEIRTLIVEAAAKSNSILPSNSNVYLHVMQKKHAWSKIIEITGNDKIDFKKVVGFLEKYEIRNKKNIHKIFKTENGTVFKVTHKMEIEGYTVVADFDVVPNLKEYTLKNAYLETIR